METDEKSLQGLVGGNFSFKTLLGGNLDKSTIVCKLCKKEFAYYQSTSSPCYRLNAKHVAAGIDNAPSSSRQCRQSTLEKMAGFRAICTAVDCQPLSVVEGTLC